MIFRMLTFLNRRWS